MKQKEKEKNSFTNSHLEEIECASAFQSPKYLTTQTIIKPISYRIDDENTKILSSHMLKKDEIPNFLCTCIVFCHRTTCALAYSTWKHSCSHGILDNIFKC